MNEPLEILRPIGIVIGICLLLLSVLIIKKGALGGSASLSLHAASNKSSYISLALFLTVGGALFYSFLAYWIVPTYNLAPATLLLLGIAYIVQLGLAWTPTSTTSKKLAYAHLLFGVILASLMILFLASLALKYFELPILSAVVIVTGTLSTFAMLIIYPLVKALHKYFLYFEVLFIGYFCIALILLALKI